jgi:hypothetical protein
MVVKFNLEFYIIDKKNLFKVIWNVMKKIKFAK